MCLILRLFVICLILVFALPVAAADFAKIGSAYTWEGIFTDGRLSTLGGSDLADRSPAALLVNPSPLNMGNGVGLSYDHADYLAGIEFRTCAGAAEWNDWRLNIAVQDLMVDSEIVRTAYEPEGTDETSDARDRMTVAGLSYDLGQALFEEPFLAWSVGAAWRRYSSTWWENTFDTWDLGTTLSWRTGYQGGWTCLTGAVSWQNVTDETYTIHESHYSLPRPLRTGLTMETAFKRAGHSGDLAKLLLAYSWSFQTGDTYRSDSAHVGLEALFLDFLALRQGYSTRVIDGITSWGIGIVLDERLLGPFTVEADWGEMSYENPAFAGKKTIWGARARYNF